MSLVLNPARPVRGDITVRLVAGTTEIGLRFWSRRQEGEPVASGVDDDTSMDGEQIQEPSDASQVTLQCVQHHEVPTVQAEVYAWLTGGKGSLKFAGLG